MAPGRENGLYVGAVGDGECRLFLRVGRAASVHGIGGAGAERAGRSGEPLHILRHG